ncbi:hypothetical protein F383_36620 [Gossypium arboreum]|uniref:Uncharacterized protein n=1 Tax=Gossypium arboreum TaxID=29729 RepID=A0A0B0MEB9_GOSAR|nr:hypothetical protein F383_36620 [Gossypium arboreum]
MPCSPISPVSALICENFLQMLLGASFSQLFPMSVSSLVSFRHCQTPHIFLQC